MFASLLKPMMLGAATRNTLVCIPLALETLKDELKVANEPCELFIPVGFATLRFGTILYFIIATLFMGTLLGRDFSVLDLIGVALLSTAASFATLGVTGLAALTPLAAVLRPFGLSYELAVPLMIIIDPIANMIRVMVNVAVNCAIPALAGGNAPEPALHPGGTDGHGGGKNLPAALKFFRRPRCNRASASRQRRVGRITGQLLAHR